MGMALGRIATSFKGPSSLTSASSLPPYIGRVTCRASPSVRIARQSTARGAFRRADRRAARSRPWVVAPKTTTAGFSAAMTAASTLQ